jgi:crotonobetainyl-CoA:carnitine CoA-transferase CaiB-like acyl-CoA transferase
MSRPNASKALAGRRVLELAGASGAYGGKLFADLGADVIKVEPPGGDPARWIPPFWGDVPGADASLPFLYLNANKRSLVLDLERAMDRARLLELARGADVVLESLPPGELERLGLGWEVLSASRPDLVLTSITGFGQTGPHRHYRSSDLIAFAASGAAHVIGSPEDPPVRLAGSQAHVLCGACAAGASLVALRHAARTGLGQHVDVSMQETMIAASLICGVGKWREDGIVPRRIGTGLVASVPSGAYACKDGSVYLMVNRPAHWKALAQWVSEVTGNREVLDPMFDGPSSARLPYRELLDLFIGEMTSRMGAQDVYREAQRRHIAMTPINGAADVARDPHLEARAYFVELEHPGRGRLRYPGPPYRLSDTPWALEHPAPRVGEGGGDGWRASERARRAPRHPLERRALEGLRVIELGAGMAVPWLGRILAWCGAEVIRIESRSYPDVTRLYVPPRNPELGIQPQLSPWFTDWNAGKRFVALDLRRPEAIELCLQLAARSDVLLENYSAGVIDKLGLGWDALARANPRLVMLSSTGYGHWGPDFRNVTWGPNLEALSGLARLSGFPGRDCTMTHFAFPDPLSALHGLFAVMAALEHRDRTDRGQRISIAQVETCISAFGQVLLEQLANGREPQALGNRSLHRAPHGCYPARGEDRWVAIAVGSDAEWRALCGVVGLDPSEFPTRESRLAGAERLDARIAAWTRERDAHEAMHQLQAAGVPASAVQTTVDQVEDPHLAARAFFESIPHLQKGTVVAPGIPLGLTGTPGHTPHAGEAIGQDNDYVFGEVLGLDAEQRRRLAELGAIETAEPPQRGWRSQVAGTP